MTRNTDGKIVPQCEATFKLDFRVVHCIREKGHDGKHEDGRGQWRPDGSTPTAASAASDAEVLAEEN